MNHDHTLSQELALLEDRYLGLATDPAWFARQRAIRWQERAEALERMAARKAARTPSGLLRAVTDALDHSRAETEAHNPGKLLELAREADEEHRPTPVVPDPRKDPL